MKKIVIETEVKGGQTIENTINSFSKLKSELKAAKGELASFEVGTEGFEQAQKKVANLTDQLGDLNDAVKINGTGVEKLSASFNLFGESLKNADPEKFKLALDGVKSAMSAIPIFLLIEGVKMLADNWRDIISIFDESAQAAKRNEEAIKSLNAQKELSSDINKNLIDQYNIDLNKAETTTNEKLELLKKINEAEKSNFESEKILAEKRANISKAYLENLKNDYKKTGEYLMSLPMSDDWKKRIDEKQIQYQKDLQLVESFNLRKKESDEKYNKSIISLQNEVKENRKKEQEKKEQEIKREKEQNLKLLEERKRVQNELSNIKIQAITDDEQREIEQAKFEHDLRLDNFLKNKVTEKEKSEFIKFNNLVLTNDLNEIDKKFTKQKEENLQKNLDLQKQYYQELDKLAQEQSKKEDEELKKSTKKTQEDILEKIQQQQEQEKAALKIKETYGKSELELLYYQRKQEIKLVGEDKEAIKLINEKYDELEYQSKVKTFQKIASIASQIGGAISSVISAFNEAQKSASEKQLTEIENSSNLRLNILKQQSEQELQNLIDSQIVKNDILEAQRNRELLLAGDDLNKKLTINEKYNQQKIAQERKFQQEQIKIKNKALLDEYAINLSKFNLENEIKKKAFESDKKARIAQTTISTLTGAAQALAGAMSLGPIAGPIVGGILAAAVTTAGAVAINKIKQEEFNAGVPPTPPVLAAIPPDVKGFGSGAGESASPNRATLFSTGQSQNTTIIPGRAGESAPIKAYVLSQEITSQQQLDAAIAAKSTF